MATSIRRVFEILNSSPTEAEIWAIERIPKGDVVVLDMEFSMLSRALALGGASVLSFSDDIDLLRRLSAGRRGDAIFKLMHPLWRWELEDESVDTVVCLHGFARFTTFDMSGVLDDIAGLSKKSQEVLANFFNTGDAVVISEAYRVLRPGGLFVISLPTNMVIDTTAFEPEDMAIIGDMTTMVLRKQDD
jgi:SAM-dependent methyltransferase